MFLCFKVKLNNVNGGWYFLKDFEIIYYVLISDFILNFVVRCDSICDSVLNLLY